MKSNITTSTNFNSLKHFNNQYNSNFVDVEFHSEQTSASVVDLYHKHEDEPDFDCEFLPDINYYTENKNTIVLETEEDFTDSYNDNQWDADIYDPYLESTYF